MPNKCKQVKISDYPVISFLVEHATEYVGLVVDGNGLCSVAATLCIRVEQLSTEKNSVPIER